MTVTTTDAVRQPFYKVLYIQVLFAITVGILLGHFYPETGVALKPLGDGFVKLIKMVIAPIIFCTVVSGIAGMQDMKTVGKTGGYALMYFEIVSTIALVIGLIMAFSTGIGTGANIHLEQLSSAGLNELADKGQHIKDVAVLSVDNPLHFGKLIFPKPFLREPVQQLTSSVRGAPERS